MVDNQKLKSTINRMTEDQEIILIEFETCVYTGGKKSVTSTDLTNFLSAKVYGSNDVKATKLTVASALPAGSGHSKEVIGLQTFAPGDAGTFWMGYIIDKNCKEPKFYIDGLNVPGEPTSLWFALY